MPEQTDLIAVFNPGSSSLKFSIFQGENALYSGQADRLGAAAGRASQVSIRGADLRTVFAGQLPPQNHQHALEGVPGSIAGLDRGGGGARTFVSHLGTGGSLCAIHVGRSVASTMGFTPIDGIPMGTRCGNISPAVLLHLLAHEKMPVEELSNLL